MLIGTVGTLAHRQQPHAARSFRQSPVSIGPKHMNPITAFLVFAFLVAAAGFGYFVNLYLGAAFFVVAVVIGMSLKMANVWQKFVILRMGKLQSVKGAGLFAIIPVLDAVVAVIDGRIQTTGFNAALKRNFGNGFLPGADFEESGCPRPQ